jgi:hypothetical protein
VKLQKTKGRLTVSRLVLGAVLAFMLSACYNRGASATSVFPIKSGERWEASITIGDRTITTEFELESAPIRESYSEDVSAEFRTTNGIKRGSGYVMYTSNLFLTYFWLSDSQYDFVGCQVQYGQALERRTVGFSSFVYQGTSQTRKDGCILTRLR